MVTMNVSLPDPMKQWVEKQAQSGRFSNASDYIRGLIREDQARSDALSDMQKLISEGIDSGVSPLSMQDIRRAALAALAK